jgi:cytochrome c biogenesis protein CcmG, thiol:disulfide interchange protein DsbE
MSPDASPPSPGGTDPALEGRTARGPGSGVRTTLLLGLVVGVAFVVGAAGVSLVAGTTGSDGGVIVGSPPDLEDRVPATARSPLPEMALPGFGGGEAAPVDLTAYRGAPLVVNFWASWCAPCVKEMPDFQRFNDAHGARVPLLGVNVRDAPANAGAFVQELGITYDLAADPQGDLYNAVQAFGMPTTLLVDPEGTIVYRHTGPLDAEELRALVDEHLDGATR